MKKFIAVLLSGIALSASAQDATRAYTLLSVEGGINLSGIGGIKFSSPRGFASAGGSYLIRPKISAYPDFSLRAMRIFKSGWGVGARGEVAVWGERDGARLTSPYGQYFGVTGNFFYAAPAISISPEVSKILLKGRNELSLGIFAGVTFSVHKEELGFSPDPYKKYGDMYYYPSTAFQVGGELQYKYWIRRNWAISATAGFQSNTAYLNDIEGVRFRMNVIPLTVGASFRL